MHPGPMFLANVERIRGSRVSMSVAASARLSGQCGDVEVVSTGQEGAIHWGGGAVANPDAWSLAVQQAYDLVQHGRGATPTRHAWSQRRRARPRAALSATVAFVLNVVACGGAAVSSPLPSSAPISPSPTEAAAPNPLAKPSVSGSFAVDSTGRTLAMTCYGQGTPAVFLESGGGALDEFTGSTLVERLAANTEVCLYNRAADSPSDPAPNRRREAEDVAADFHALVQAAKIAAPYILFGRSFGGMVVTFYAATYPADVVGVVVFDSPAPDPNSNPKGFPEGVWNHPDNRGHLDVVFGYEARFGKHPVKLTMPLILISPTHGESTPDDKYWLQTSPRSRQVVLEGGTEVIDTQADRIADEILSLRAGTAAASPS